MQHHQGILYRVALAYCSDDEDRKDLMQEMKLQVWEALPRYKEQAQISTWLYRVALNTALNFYRENKTKAKKKQLFQEDSLRVPFDDSPNREAMLQQLEQFIQELDPLDKALMVLYLEDKSQKEIADILGLSISNISTKVNRIKSRMKKRFTQFNPDPHE